MYRTSACDCVVSVLAIALVEAGVAGRRYAGKRPHDGRSCRSACPSDGQPNRRCGQAPTPYDAKPLYHDVKFSSRLSVINTVFDVPSESCCEAHSPAW